jgi:hypothetical protein
MDDRGVAAFFVAVENTCHLCSTLRFFVSNYLLPSPYQKSRSPCRKASVRNELLHLRRRALLQCPARPFLSDTS